MKKGRGVRVRGLRLPVALTRSLLGDKDAPTYVVLRQRTERSSLRLEIFYGRPLTKDCLQLRVQTRDGHAHRGSYVLKFQNDAGEEEPERVTVVLSPLSRSLPKPTCLFQVRGLRLLEHGRGIRTWRTWAGVLGERPDDPYGRGP